MQSLIIRLAFFIFQRTSRFCLVLQKDHRRSMMEHTRYSIHCPTIRSKQWNKSPVKRSVQYKCTPLFGTIFISATKTYSHLISPPLLWTNAFSITVHLACSRAIRLTRFWYVANFCTKTSNAIIIPSIYAIKKLFSHLLFYLATDRR